ncbi:tail fiber domain-containing protein [Roseiarcus sp.]|uniref:tail fiber domain-containing protein n=1 Tax=Roseiarcus sp. TaxID=1969460 RepID=UPI003D1209F1
MTQLQNQETATPETADLNDAELLGFEHIETAPGSSTSTEDAVGLALNKRGESGEGPVIISDRRLKTHVQRAGGTAEGLNLYSFRYIGEDHEFRGVMAQELLADERHRGAVEVGADGYYRVHYARLGLASLATDEMRAAGERAARRAGALAH